MTKTDGITRLFPSMTSMRSSALASYLKVISALAIRYSLKMDLTESMSSSDWVHCDTTTVNMVSNGLIIS